MDFSAKLENLKAKVDEVVASARAAAAEDRDQLKHRVDQAQDDANKAVADAKQRADEATDRAQSKWAQMKADAAARREDIKAKIDKRADQLDAKTAAQDADWAEDDAADAIDYAVLVVSDTQLAVLDGARRARLRSRTGQDRPQLGLTCRARCQCRNGGPQWTRSPPRATLIIAGALGPSRAGLQQHCWWWAA